ncbi:hypothetical protein KAR91_72750 [Candidatus Pacearchaeota archaeon]|nr:hypothetical protein [Candidatus Pacearchaeota archaeon]
MGRKKAARKKKYDPNKFGRDSLCGLTITWEDTHPLSDENERDETTVSNTGETHDNPIHNLRARDIFVLNHKNIRFVWPLGWTVSIGVVFLYDNGMETTEWRHFDFYGKMCEAEDTCHKAIKDAYLYGNMDKYITTKYKFECLGA